MTHYSLQPRKAAIALSIVALASCGLTACGSSSSDPTTQPQQAVSPQQAAIRLEGIKEIVNCARRHGIHLPPPTAAGVNVSGVKGRHNEVLVSACYHNAIKLAERRLKAEQEK